MAPTEPEVVAELRDSFAAVLRAADPGALVEAHLPDEPPALILAVGKAAIGMLAAARRHAPGAPWLAAPPHGSSGDGQEGGQVLSGSHPLPDSGSVAAAEAALAAVARLEPQQLALVLVSGGGSALWSAPRGIDLATKRELTEGLLLAGADISQLNTVRKHLSGIKGGGLARATRGRLLTLALSDVPGDDPATIASGPTLSDASTFEQALQVLDEFGLNTGEAAAHLRAGARGEIPETPKPGDEIDGRSRVEVIGSNATLLAAAARFWDGRGYQVLVLPGALQGEAGDLARAHADLATALARGADPSPALARLAPPGEVAALASRLTDARLRSGGGPLVLLSGGEATVTVTGGGRGGRNQEFVLWLHHYLRSTGSDPQVAALVAGSDGIDGNSAAAGAVISASTAARADALGLVASDYLRDNDSHSFFAELGDTVVTGPTGTNLNDYRVIVVDLAG